MTEYHVGCGVFGIYAGRLNKKGDRWLSKNDVTEEVLNSAFDYLYTNKKEIRAKVEGKEYVMRIMPYVAEGSEGEAVNMVIKALKREVNLKEDNAYREKKWGNDSK